eukprot:172421_1
MRLLCLYLLSILITWAEVIEIQTSNYIGIKTLNDKYNWSESQAYCIKKFNTNLATILNKRDQEEIFEIISDSQWNPETKKVWIGWKKQSETIYSWTPCSNCIKGHECSAYDQIFAEWHGTDKNIANDSLAIAEFKCGVSWIKRDRYLAMGKWRREKCDQKLDFICNKKNGRYDPMPFQCGSSAPTLPTALPTKSPTISDEGYPKDIEIIATASSTHYHMNGTYNNRYAYYGKYTIDGEVHDRWIYWKPGNERWVIASVRGSNQIVTRCARKILHQCNKSGTKTFRIQYCITAADSSGKYYVKSNTYNGRWIFERSDKTRYIFYHLGNIKKNIKTGWKISSKIGSDNILAECNQGNIFNCSISSSEIDFSTCASTTQCKDYGIYNSSDGTDKIDNIHTDMEVTYKNYVYSNMTFDSYITNEERTKGFYGETITCNDTNADVCFVGCYRAGQCINTVIEPTANTEVSELYIVCSESNSCQYLNVNVNMTTIERVNILCGDKFSCNGAHVTINTSNIVQLNIDCNESFACYDLSIHLIHNIDFDADLELYMFAKVSCFDDYSCSNMMIKTYNSRKIFIKMYVYQYSENILINHHYRNNIQIICGSKNDQRYIKYSSSQILQPSELLQIAQKKYLTNNLPCRGIVIDCTRDTNFRQQCEYLYELSDYVDFEQILNDTEQSCYWIEIGDLFTPYCKGTCNDDIIYNQYEITFNLHFVLRYDFCREFFGTVEDTQTSLRNVDDTLDAQLRGFASGSIINDILLGPQTILRDNIMKIDCKNKNDNVVQMTTKVIIDSIETDKNVIDELFSNHSQFIEAQEKTISEMFDDISSTSIIGIAHGYVFVIVIFGLCIITCIVGIMLYKRAKRRAKIQRKTVKIQNAMVIAISIGIYDEEASAPDIDGYLKNLLDIHLDIENTEKLYHDILNYDIFSNLYEENESYQIEWKHNELTTFFKQKAVYLNQNIQTGRRYDGLVVIVSGHGISGNILTSDYRTISKTKIHRIFSKQQALRMIPRIFMFDSCSGDSEKVSISRFDDEMGKLILPDDEIGKPILPDDDENVRYRKSILWALDEHNPDHLMILINAANKGFIAKMNSKKGSYLIAEYMEKMIDNIKNCNNKKFLMEILDEIQQKLHHDGKSLIEYTPYNGTSYIKFSKNKTIKDQDNVGGYDSIPNAMIRLKL